MSEVSRNDSDMGRTVSRAATRAEAKPGGGRLNAARLSRGANSASRRMSSGAQGFDQNFAPSGSGCRQRAAGGDDHVEIGIALPRDVRELDAVHAARQG